MRAHAWWTRAAPWVCAAIAVAGVVLALSFLPGRTAAATATKDEPVALEDEAVVGG
jgi:hypothetical protein